MPKVNQICRSCKLHKEKWAPGVMACKCHVRYDPQIDEVTEDNSQHYEKSASDIDISCMGERSKSNSPKGKKSTVELTESDISEIATKLTVKAFEKYDRNCDGFIDIVKEGQELIEFFA
jgi:hypothetical protein